MKKKHPQAPFRQQWQQIRCANDLCHSTRCIDQDTLNSEVYKVFEKHPELQCLPVTGKDRIIGLINRESFMTEMAGRFHWEVYSKKRCVKLMQDDPLIIDADMTIPDIASRLLDTGAVNTLADNFIVTRAGQLLGIGYTRNVMAVLLTQEQQATEELRRHHERLTQMVEERTHDLLQAKLAAERANLAKSEFLSNMSHELRTPLHAVLAFSHKGLEKAKEAPRGKLENYFNYITESATRLSKLVHELLDLSALDSGNAQLKPVPADLCALARRVVDEAFLLAEGRAISLVFEAKIETAPIICEPERARQVLRNVIGNAIKFSPPASTVRVLTRWKYSATANEHDLPTGAVVHVIDQGPGIPDDELDGIFEHFTQSTVTRTGAGGKGLGLAISREIMRLHGGSISARNNPEGGACFVIEFPVRQPAAHTAAYPAEGSSPPASGI
ncbi:MAG: PAS domain S-box [Rhodocyclaceae bacterium]|nr:MAG: PAS domain S-box [Rhodocyclaceae bacterium]